MSKRRIGFSRERELVRLLWKHGFAVVRGPASGSKTKRIIYPDIVAIKKGCILVFEVKTREKPEHIYIPREQFLRFLEFVKRSGGMGFIAVKIMDGRGWRFIPIEKVEETPGGNYKVSIESIEDGYTIDYILELCREEESLEKWIKQ